MLRLLAAFDRYTLALVATLLAAMVIPCSGTIATVLDAASTFAIALLFFLHGARLSRDAIIAGLIHWRLHLLVLACTYVMFPLFGSGIEWLMPAGILAPDLMIGVLFLCALPSTVQSSIAFTSMARGNVAAAVCSASLSNLLGVFLAPALVALMLHTESSGAPALGSIGKIVVQLFLPFVLGHLARPLIGRTVERSSRLLAYTDRGTVLLIVYVAFSASVIDGLWAQLSVTSLLALLGVVALLLVLALNFTTLLGRRFDLSVEDEIAVVFCGSKKSLASGVPIAKILFAGNPALGMIVVPILLYHQIQLIACAVLARRYARRLE